MEVGITTERALPYLPGQYVQVRFEGYPSRPFSITHALRGPANSRTIFFHIRRMDGGRVTPDLGTRITTGHRVVLKGPLGSAHFRPQTDGRMILIATNTGFAPIWSIAAAALRENQERSILVIAGGRGLQALYMGPALAQLARFPNVRIVPVCSRSENLPPVVLPGRPTDYLPPLVASDQIYACGAAGMVEQVRAIAASAGAACYADPFLPSKDAGAEAGLLSRAMGWLSLPANLQSRRTDSGPERREPLMAAFATADIRVKRHLGP
jgi:3-phenylpropionate/trans-cinnamate dioxygenase ferredoxin reductase subunit